MNDGARQICFVDMPFGRRTDPISRVKIDFDHIYDAAISPAIEAAGLVPIRGDREESGGIIHRAMFARLLLAEYVVADMTSASPNVFYELGVRHTAKPYTTIPIFATLNAPPFDVNMVRAIPYDLEDGQLNETAAAALRDSIQKRIAASQHVPVDTDSPIFELFPEFKGIQMSHELTDVFRERVRIAAELRNKLAGACKTRPREAAIEAIREVLHGLGDVATLERGVLIEILLSFRAVEAWPNMVALYEAMPANVQVISIARQQFAFALNRRAGPGDRDRAVTVLTQLLKDEGESAETRGLLGRVYKDLYQEAKQQDPKLAAGWLDLAIEAYRLGFEVEPIDYYPGINAITLLMEKGTEKALAEAQALEPLVAFAAVRQGGESAGDYWTVATVVELAFIRRDYALVERTLPRALALATEVWMPRTTAANLRMIADRRGGEPEIDRVIGIVNELEDRAASMETN